MTDSIVNDSDLINVQHNLVEASENLRIATCCLRSCYAVAEPRNQDFLRLRTQVTNDAFVYKLKLLPMSQSVIVKFRQFFEYYSTLTYDQFRQRISTIAQGTRVYAEQALFVAETHKEFLIDLKRKEDDCHRVYETLQLEKRNYDAKVRELREAIETRHDWATGLLFFPGIGTIASGVLSVVNMSALDDVVQLQRESELVVAAATMIQDQIIRALDNFVGGMEKVAGFMVLLESEIRTLADRADEAAEEAIKLHYLKLRNRSNDIIDHCNKYIQSVPESMTNLESIPQVYDRYYVQQWLTSKRNESRGILFSDWAITLFKDQPDVINVIVGQY